ncbi:hypothetical protein C8A03DRAFT_14031 [Achaetomium macrosporum]|uniref:Methyltransferase domain-containing protein n=1 Tax=Achaetomium macrosporum TaxID=79813 RepID=A0AAN7CCN1_9PEZI|nr:hypothetical protein C8A03DRAFT_14031 [Achaetomium macrosporum]
MSAPIPTPNPPPDLKARLKESYNAIAEAYKDWTALHNVLRTHYTEELCRFLRRDRSRTTNGGGTPPPPGEAGISLARLHALELGCGCGIPVIEMLLAKEMDVIGVDLSSAQVQLTKNHFPTQIQNTQLVVVEKDIMDLTYPPDEFDVVVALYSLIHLPRDEQRVIMERVQRWLKPGGMILMNFSTTEMEGEVVESWLEQDGGWMYWSAWGKEKTLEMIRELNFNVLLEEVKEDEGTDASFVWVIAQKTGPPAEFAPFEEP